MANCTTQFTIHLSGHVDEGKGDAQNSTSQKRSFPFPIELNPISMNLDSLPKTLLPPVVPSDVAHAKGKNVKFHYSRNFGKVAKIGLSGREKNASFPSASGGKCAAKSCDFAHFSTIEQFHAK